MERRLGLVLIAAFVHAACFDFGVPRRLDGGVDAEPRDATSADGGDAGVADVDVQSDAEPADGGDAALDATTCPTEGPAEPLDGGPTVLITGLSLDRPLITIRAGDVLTWTNAADRGHRFKSGEPNQVILPENGGFDTDRIAPGTSYAHRFCTPRTVMYFCSTHPTKMNGFRIVVE